MELIMINHEKLKIILSNDDMTEMKITPRELDYSKVSTKHIFWNILEKAQKEVGFNADKSKLYVQVFPSRDGGCEMFVTKYADDEQDEIEIQPKRDFRNTVCLDKFIVVEFSDLLKLSIRMAMDKLKLNTSLYYDSQSTYILLVRNNKKLPSYIHSMENCCRIPEYLSEYGNVYDLTEKALCYIKEHYKIITQENAVEILSAI